MELPKKILDNLNKEPEKIDDINVVYKSIFSKKKTGEDIIKKLKDIEKKDKKQVVELINLHFSKPHNIATKIILDVWAIAFYERQQQYQEALDNGVLILQKRQEDVLIGTIFRICKKLNNYDVAENIILKYNINVKSTDSFHILYGLVFYYEHKKDEKSLNEVLLRIEKQFKDSIPVQNTLRNIYIQLKRVEDAKRVSNNLDLLKINDNKSLKVNNKFAGELTESTENVIELAENQSEIIQNQLASQKQVEFIQQMIRGFSHEMGQPITNIRFTIQLYSKISKQNFSPEKVIEIFDMILKETERMSDLAEQLKPITSSKNQVSKYNLITLIEQRILVENARLSSNNIEVIVKNPKNIDVNIVGDLQKMEQVINNLLINAIDVLAEINETQSKQIIVEITGENKNFIELDFKDTGTGIPADIADKIFTVYFTTKTNKGQGLGLFIVKNLLQAQGGDIQLEKATKQGACFKLKIPKISKNFNTI
jgi:signal transduction histidine kinase